MENYIHSSAIIDDSASIGVGVRIWHFCHVRSGATIEDGVTLGKDVYVDLNVTIGRFSRVQNGVSIYQGVSIAPWCFVGPHVIFTNDLNPRAGNKHWKVLPTVLKSGASIGAGAVIRCGITLGEFSMVGAGAIVTRDIPPFHLVLGFPAEAVKMICACGQKQQPLGSAPKDLLLDCCVRNMDPELYRLAKEHLGL